jgi:inner membrane protein
MPKAHPARRLVAATAPTLAVLCIVGLDRIATARHWPVPVAGLLDEPAHLLTAWLALMAIGAERLRPWRWVLLGATAIDVDHIPVYLWAAPVTVDGGRPVTHSLLTVLILLAVAGAVRRARGVLVGLAAGVLLHFVRDIATGPGVPLLWPFRTDGVLLPYAAYLLLLVALASISTIRRLRPRTVRSRPRDRRSRPGGHCATTPSAGRRFAP